MIIDSVLLADGSALPNSIIFDGKILVIFATNTFSETGSYLVKVTAKDPKSLIKNSDLTFSVTVKCTKRIDV